MRGVSWKFRGVMNCWEGTVRGGTEPSIFIEGRLCVSDLRESRSSKEYVSPKHYKIIGLTLEEAKELAEDLVNNVNFDKHESNRLQCIKEQEETTKMLKEAQDFLNKLKKR